MRTAQSFPHFLGLGAQKAGTTSLHCWLSQHPQVFLPKNKELQFFSLHFQRGIDWYYSHFPRDRSAYCCGDITPYYLFHPLAPVRIHTVAPHAKLIVLVRDPVERTLSGLFHSIRLGLETLEPMQALEAEEERLKRAVAEVELGLNHAAHQDQSYFSRSCYEAQIARYLELYPRNQILLLRSEDLFSFDAQSTLERILDFLDLPKDGMPLQMPHSNAGKGETNAINPEIRRWLRKRLEPTYAAMEKNYGILWETEA